MSETSIKSEYGELAGCKKYSQLMELNLNLFVKSLVSQNYNCIISKECFVLNRSGNPSVGMTVLLCFWRKVAENEDGCPGGAVVFPSIC